MQNIAAAADIGGNTAAPEYILQNRAVFRHISGRYGNVAEAVPAAAHQPQDVGGHRLHFGIGRACLVDPNLLRFPLPNGVRAEEMRLQMLQRRIRSVGKIFHLAGHTVLFCHTKQALLLPQGVKKQLAIPFIPQQRHRDIVCLVQNHGENALLLLVEIGKSVKINILTAQISGILHMIAELLHTGAGIHGFIVQLGIVGGIEQGDRAQLIAHCALHIRHLLIQFFRSNLIGVKFIRQIRQLAQKSRTLGGLAEHLQLAVYLLQGKAHGQQLAAVIQRKVRQAACLRQHTVGQSAKAQHLRIPRGRFAQGTAKIHLRFVGGVLRHQKHLSAPGALCLDAFQHFLRFAGPCPSDPDLQHGSLLLYRLFSYFLLYFLSGIL